jgi:hypothetical protein
LLIVPILDVNGDHIKIFLLSIVKSIKPCVEYFSTYLKFAY